MTAVTVHVPHPPPKLPLRSTNAPKLQRSTNAPTLPTSCSAPTLLQRSNAPPTLQRSNAPPTLQRSNAPKILARSKGLLNSQDRWIPYNHNRSSRTGKYAQFGRVIRMGWAFGSETSCRVLETGRTFSSKIT